MIAKNTLLASTSGGSPSSVWHTSGITSTLTSRSAKRVMAVATSQTVAFTPSWFSTASTITGLSVAANSKNQDAALDFVKFVSGPEGAAVVAKTGTFPAITTEDVLNTITSTDGFPSDEQSKEALVTSHRYLEIPVSPIAPEIDLVLSREHDAIMTGSETVDQGIENMNKGVAELKNQ